MTSTISRLSQGPRSIDEIVTEAQNFDHQTEYPLRIALRTAQSMHNQVSPPIPLLIIHSSLTTVHLLTPKAANYERDGNAEAAFLFYYRHADFYFSHIANHHAAKQPEHKMAVARVRHHVNANISKLETLKPLLKTRYERYHQLVQNRHAAKTVQSVESHILNPTQHNHLALRLANLELDRRASAPLHESQLSDDLSRNIRAVGRQLDATQSDRPVDRPAQLSSYNYPAVPSKHYVSSPTDPSFKSALPYTSFPPAYKLPPSLPSKEPMTSSTVTNIPPLPLKEHLSSASYTFEPTAFTEGGLPLRTIFLPAELRAQFLSVAHSNTRQNLETCGILCGSLISNAFFISRLIIPDQTSTSDTCEVTEQGDVNLFDYVDGRNMTVCGWIHTHPSQTCFLSSRDLHTSVGYQVMLPESVAIVCAPSKSPE